MFKTSEVLEQAGKIQIAALDKTGTITAGKPEVTDILANGITEKELLEKAYALEQRSEHPLAKAITERAEKDKLTLQEVRNFEAVAGNGLKAENDEGILYGGSLKYINGIADVDGNMQQKAKAFAEQGKTPLLFAQNDHLLGMIAVADVIKDDSREAIRELQNMGIEVVMVTGDNRRTAEAIAKAAGVDRVIADVLPDGKEEVIRKLQERGKTAMVGDGINDAPALTRADIGIAIGAGTDVAIDSADVVLMNSSLKDAAAAVRLSRATLRNIHENLFWAFFYNIICIPLAAGLYGWKMNPMIGAAAMSLSSFTVCMNALRLNLARIFDASKDRPLKKKALPETEPKPLTEETPQEITETIEVGGMMCEHCEARVSKALCKCDGITSAKADHHTGTVVLTMTHPVEESMMKQAVEEQDYEYIGKKGEAKTMKKTLNVEGMMCEHCEARVKKALEKVDGVVCAAADKDAGTAVVELSKDVADDILIKAVEDQDYTVKGIA